MVSGSIRLFLAPQLKPGLEPWVLAACTAPGCWLGRILAVHPCGSSLQFILVSFILVVHLCGSLSWLNFAVHLCGSSLQFILAVHPCGSSLQLIFAVHSRHSYSWLIFAVHSCSPRRVGSARHSSPQVTTDRSGSQCCPTRHAEGPCGCEQNTWTSTVLQEGEGTFSGLTWVCVTQTHPHPKPKAGPAAEPHRQGVGASAGSLPGARPPGPSPQVAPQPGPASPSLSPSLVTLTSPQGRVSGS